MSDAPSLEYPAPFPIKLFLKPDARVEEALLEALREVLNPGNQIESARRPSSGGKYICLSLSYTAQDADEVERIRQLVNAHPQVIMSL